MMTRSELRDEAQAVAQLVAAADGPEIWRALADWLRLQVGFDDWIALAFRRDGPPLLLVGSGPQAWRDPYADGAYILDPFYDAFRRRDAAGCFRLRDIAPDDFETTDYYRNYYGPPHFGDEMGFLVPADGAIAINLALSRTGKRHRFSAAERDRLALATPVVAELAARAWRRHHAAEISGADADLHARVLDAFDRFAATLLTEREREIVQFLFRGHSAKSMARELSISPGTVHAHMKNIYRKLEVGSQAELFSLFLQSITAPTRERDAVR